jgi:hypothetical protein
VLVSGFEHTYGGNCFDCQGCSDHRREVSYFVVNSERCILTAICDIGRDGLLQGQLSDFAFLNLSDRSTKFVHFSGSLWLSLELLFDPPSELYRNRQQQKRKLIEAIARLCELH